MQKKLFIIALCLTLIFSNLVYGEEIKNDEIIEETEVENILPITIEELGSPKYLTAEVIDDYFLLNWTNNTMALLQSSIYRLDYQIDYKVGKGEWLSSNSDKFLPTYILELNSNGKSSAYFDPKLEKVNFALIDLEKNSYSIRLRYRYVYEVDGIEKYIYGNFSSPANLGLQPYYQGASEWAIPELDKAVEYGLITDNIRSNMQANITREEFCELVINMYEKQTNKPASYTGNPFTDIDNEDVYKASSLGIVVGVGDGKFAPNNPVTRQEMAVMLKRSLALVYPKVDYSGVGAKIFSDDNQISEWALKELRFLTKYDLIKGNEDGKVLPLGNTTREQAVAIIVRAFEMFK